MVSAHHRTEIDGLRAIAVIPVVLYHFGLGMPGGWVGVDVFFVISGFLITGLICRDLSSGTFSLAKFWERRARRILPAAVTMVAVSLIAGWFLLAPDDLRSLGESGRESIGFPIERLLLDGVRVLRGTERTSAAPAHVVARG